MEQNNANRMNPSVNVRGATPVARPNVSADPIQHPGGAKPKGKKETSLVKKIIIGVIALVVVLSVVFSYQLFFAGARIDGGKYQAVFLSNGQVYFGKLQDTSGEYMYLNDVYYIQAKTATADANNPQQTSASQTNVELVKLGNEVHGPVDQMTIRKEQVLFFENLKSEGQVAKTIAEDKKQK